jgi:integrase
VGTKRAVQAGKYQRVPGRGYEGVYERNGTYSVAIWDPSKGTKGRKAWHTLGKCSCGREHPGTTKQDAKALKALLEAEKRDRQNMAAEVTVDEWAGRDEDGRWVSGRWVAEHPRPAQSTNMHNNHEVRAFARQFAGRPLGSITEQEANAFALAHPGVVKVLHAMYNDAVAMKLVRHNPFVGLRPSRRKGRGGAGTPFIKDDDLRDLCELAKLLGGAHGAVFAAMIQTAAWTGVRPGELFLLSMEPGDRVNFADVDAEVLHVDWQLNARTGEISRPKNNSVRKVALLPGALDALRSVQRTQQPDRPLFLTKRGSGFTQRSLNYHWSPVRDAFTASRPPGHWLRKRLGPDGPGGDGNLDFYELRHFFGSKLASRGVTPMDIAVMMGHKDGGDIAMRVYIHTDEEDARERIWAAFRRAS